MGVGRNSKPLKWAGCAAFSVLYSQYRLGAKRRGLSFDLDPEWFKVITNMACTYCGRPPIRVFKSRGSQYVYNGIDRLDSTQGYSRPNCLSCCWDCNRAKGQMSHEEFLTHIQRQYLHAQAKGYFQDLTRSAVQ